MTYTIMASDWDRAHMEEVSAQCEKGNLMPTMVDGVRDLCGRIPQTTRSEALKALKAAKKAFPFIQWTLVAGAKFGYLKPIASM